MSFNKISTYQFEVNKEEPVFPSLFKQVLKGTLRKTKLDRTDTTNRIQPIAYACDVARIGNSREHLIRNIN